MRLVHTVVMLTVLAPALAGAAQANEERDVRAGLEGLWAERIGTPVPAQVADAFRSAAEHMTAADVASLLGATATNDDDEYRTYGDVWSVCLSESGGCSVQEVYNTASDPKHCDHYPVADLMWVYVTNPAIFDLTATGDAVGTWSAYTLDEAGTFTSGRVTGTSCIVLDDPNVFVVRTNGIAEYGA